MNIDSFFGKQKGYKQLVKYTNISEADFKKHRDSLLSCAEGLLSNHEAITDELMNEFRQLSDEIREYYNNLNTINGHVKLVNNNLTPERVDNLKTMIDLSIIHGENASKHANAIIDLLQKFK